MEAINCDRCAEYTMEWKTLSIYNQTDKTYLNARNRRGSWVTKPESYSSNPKIKQTIDVCIPCFKNVEMAIADNVGQVFFDEVKTDV